MVIKKNSYLEDFEGLIIRNDYLKRASFDKNSFIEFKNLSKITAEYMFFKYSTFYSRISYYQDDVEQLCNCYLISYISLYSFRFNTDLKDKFIAKYTKQNDEDPTKEILAKEDRNRAIMFMRQQCNNSITVVNRKSRNIIADKDNFYYFAMTQNSLPISKVENLIKDSKKYNYRKITLKEYKMLQKQQGKKDNIVDLDGFKVILVRKLADSMFIYEDYDYIEDNKYSPETILGRIEEEMSFNQHINDFEFMENKALKLNSFIEKHKKDVKYKDEVMAAKKILKKL